MTQDQRLRFVKAKNELSKIKAEIGEEVGKFATTKNKRKLRVLVEPMPFARLCTEYAGIEAALTVLEKV